MYLEPTFDASEARGQDGEPALAEQLGRFVQAARSAFSSNTERAIRSDLGIYAEWCAVRGERALPAKAETVASFVDAVAEVRAPATVRRYLASIAIAHRALGFSTPLPAQPTAPAETRVCPCPAAAVARTLSEPIPILADAPTDHATRSKWLERLFAAVQSVVFQVEIMGGMQQVVRLATREQGRGSIVQGQFDTETLCPTAVLPFIPREDPDLEPMKLFGQLEPRVMELPQKRLHVLPIRRPALERKDQSLGFGITGRVFTGKNTAGEVRGQHEKENDSSHKTCPLAWIRRPNAAAADSCRPGIAPVRRAEEARITS